MHLTHDVDHPFATLGVGPGAVVRQAAGDVVRRRDVRLAGRRMRSYAAARRGVLSFDPFNTHGFLMDVSERHGLCSSFYFLAGSDGGAYAADYRLTDPPIARLLTAVAARGHEIGLHGSYAALRDGTRLRREFERLRSAARAPEHQAGALGRSAALPALGEPDHVGGRGSRRGWTTMPAPVSPSSPGSARAPAGNTRSST